ncbi:LOW QUALITY PROTEIN: uncharacterized protein ACIBXB_006311 [Morphnus guianensis]
MPHVTPGAPRCFPAPPHPPWGGPVPPIPTIPVTVLPAQGCGSNPLGLHWDTPSPGQPLAALEAVMGPVAPAAALAAPVVAPVAAPAAPAVALAATALEAPVLAAVSAFLTSLPAAGWLVMPEPVLEVPPSPCTLGPCFSGGACTPDPAPGAGYTCCCPPGFHGSNCEGRALCLHGGQCRDLGRSTICKCQPGFSGRRCEHNADDCTPNPCANCGTCQDGANTFTCSCTLGYTGADCDASASGPCLHSATCYTHFSGHICTCPPGFMGSCCKEEVGGPPSGPPMPPSPCWALVWGWRCDLAVMDTPPSLSLGPHSGLGTPLPGGAYAIKLFEMSVHATVSLESGPGRLTRVGTPHSGPGGGGDTPVGVTVSCFGVCRPSVPPPPGHLRAARSMARRSTRCPRRSIASPTHSCSRPLPAGPLPRAVLGSSRGQSEGRGGAGGRVAHRPMGGGADRGGDGEGRGRAGAGGVWKRRKP